MRFVRGFFQFFDSRGKSSMLAVRVFLFGALWFALSACSTVDVEYSSFSSLNSLNQGDTFYVLPSDAQATSGEFNHYVTSITRRLSDKGWHRVLHLDDAKYIVLLDYGISGSSTAVGSAPIFGQTSAGGYGAYGTYSAPTFGVVGSQTYSFTKHQRYFEMRVIEKANSAPVYEVKSASRGRSSTFGQVAECIFDATLEDFPIQEVGSKSVVWRDCGK